MTNAPRVPSMATGDPETYNTWQALWTAWRTATTLEGAGRTMVLSYWRHTQYYLELLSLYKGSPDAG